MSDITMVPIASIKPYWRNPRKADESSVKAVARSISRFGFNQPLVLDKNNVIIVGHTRFKALMQLNFKEVPCVIADLTAEQAKEYRIIDNKSNELTSWDWEKLIPELRELDLLELKPFFVDIDLDETLRDAANISSPVTQERFDKRSAELNDRFKNGNKETLSDFINLMCPECGNEFSVSRTDVLKRPD
jgi:site-specific DNA-methyltransferase (adenine-specific)